jgi:hypothetical protein
VSQVQIKFRLLTGVRQAAKRMVGLLEGQEELDTTSGIGSLAGNQRRDLLSRAQHWLDGANSPKRWFHNFPDDPVCPACFVFRVGDHRFYGYLCHPLPKTNPALQVCVLCSHAIKHEWETDPAEKTLVKRWSLSNQARAALAEEFDDKPQDDKSKESKNRKGISRWKM